ncbi:tol-pal system YbgF family protein [Ancylomarina sp.]|uniref:tetratricopeptide repeat protein n=1 Tax=Ancylomarina sp. TaxID=1970196 RepID=UPI00356457B1
MMDEKNFDRIDNYLDDQLNENEILDFEKDLMDDLDLEMELNLHNEINEAIMEEDVMELRSKLEAIDILTPDVKRKVKFQGKWRIAAASMILFIGMAGIYSLLGDKTYTNEEIFSNYYKPYGIVINTRSVSDADNTDKVLEQALQSYESKNYRAALSLFQTILDKDSTNLTSNFYSGISNIQVQEYPKANKNFIRVLKHKNNLFIEQSEWYLGICYLMTNEREKAKETYSAIAKGNSFYRTKAKEILNKLE